MCGSIEGNYYHDWTIHDFFKFSLLKPEQCLSVINVLMVIIIGKSNLLCKIKLNCDVSGDISAIFN